MDTYKKIQTYLRLAELCSPSDEERKLSYMVNIENLLTESEFTEEIYDEKELDEKDKELLGKILKYGDMKVPKNWKRLTLKERIVYTQDYLLDSHPSEIYEKDLENVCYISSLVVFHEILGFSGNKVMTDKLRRRINLVLRELLEYGYEKKSPVSLGLAYPKKMRVYAKHENDKKEFIGDF